MTKYNTVKLTKLELSRMVHIVGLFTNGLEMPQLEFQLKKTQKKFKDAYFELEGEINE